MTTATMTSMQRVLTTLGHNEPDRVPLFLLVTLHGGQLEIPHAGSQVDHFVTVSLGISQGDASAEMTADAVLRAADAALYEAKKQGRDRVVIADTEKH